MNEVYTVAELAIANNEDKTLKLVTEQLEAGNVLHSDYMISSSASILDGMSEEFKLRLVTYVINSNDPSLSKQRAQLEIKISQSATLLANDYDTGF